MERSQHLCRRSWREGWPRLKWTSPLLQKVPLRESKFEGREGRVCNPLAARKSNPGPPRGSTPGGPGEGVQAPWDRPPRRPGSHAHALNIKKQTTYGQAAAEAEYVEMAQKWNQARTQQSAAGTFWPCCECRQTFPAEGYSIAALDLKAIYEKCIAQGS